MFADNELAIARQDILITLPDSAIIVRRTPGVDSSGYPSESESAAGTVVCRLDPMSTSTGNQQVVGDQELQRARFMFTTVWDADLRDGDAVTINGKTLEVQQIFDLHSDRLVTRAIVSKIGE
jgi:hypothetical protein